MSKFSKAWFGRVMLLIILAMHDKFRSPGQPKASKFKIPMP